MQATSKDYFIRKAANYNQQQLNYHKKILDALCIGTINATGATYVLLNSNQDVYKTTAIVCGSIGILSSLALAAIAKEKRQKDNSPKQEEKYKVYTKILKPHIEI